MLRKDVQGSVRRKAKWKWRDKKNSGVTMKDLLGEVNFVIVLGTLFCLSDLLLRGL